MVVDGDGVDVVLLKALEPPGADGIPGEGGSLLAPLDVPDLGQVDLGELGLELPADNLAVEGVAHQVLAFLVELERNNGILVPAHLSLLVEVLRGRIEDDNVLLAADDQIAVGGCEEDALNGTLLVEVEEPESVEVEVFVGVAAEELE